MHHALCYTRYTLAVAFKRKRNDRRFRLSKCGIKTVTIFLFFHIPSSQPFCCLLLMPNWVSFFFAIRSIFTWFFPIKGICWYTEYVPLHWSERKKFYVSIDPKVGWQFLVKLDFPSFPFIFVHVHFFFFFRKKDNKKKRKRCVFC